jgi:hypothetical protein
MANSREEVKGRIVEVLKSLTTDERRLLQQVLLTESTCLNQKSPSLGPEVTRLVRQIIL